MRRGHRQEGDNANNTEREGRDVSVLPKRGITRLGGRVGRSRVTHLVLVAAGRGGRWRVAEVSQGCCQLTIDRGEGIEMLVD